MTTPTKPPYDWVYGLVAIVVQTAFGAFLIACALGTVLVVVVTGGWMLVTELSPEMATMVEEAMSTLRPNWRNELRVSYLVLGFYWLYMAYLTGRDALTPR